MGKIRVPVGRATTFCLMLLLLPACASAPKFPSAESPFIGCEFDSLRRFRYALIIEYGDDTHPTRWRRRQIMSNRPDLYDTEVYSTPSYLVRRGYCPDEVQHMFEPTRPVWRQPADDISGDSR